MDDEKMGVGIAETIRSMTDKANAMAAETRLQFDTLVEMQFDREKLLLEQMDKQRKHFMQIIIGLIIAIAIFIGGFFGTAIYVLANYDIMTTTYQETYVGGDGQSTINDGINYNKDK